MKIQLNSKNKIRIGLGALLLLAVLFVLLLFGNKKTKDTAPGTYYTMTVNGVEMGTVDSKDTAERLMRKVRREVALSCEDTVFMDPELVLTEVELPKSQVSTEDEVVEELRKWMPYMQMATTGKSYTVKFNELFLTLNSLEEVAALLQSAIDKYDTENAFEVQLVYDPNREIAVMGAEVVRKEEMITEEQPIANRYGGITEYLSNLTFEASEKEEKSFSDYRTGVMTMDFVEKIEIIPSYVPENFRTGLDRAVQEIVTEQEVPQIYKVQSGDTLSAIAIQLNIPMDRIVEMNDSLNDVNSVLHIDQELIVTIPEPKLSVTRREQNYYEEIYDEEVQVIEVDTWYTNQIELVQQPSAGFRKIIADVTYVNDTPVDKLILLEDVVMEAVPKIVKRGTKIPPTYVKPISGGRFTSGFGKRTAPTKGASTYHKGVDWAIPTGTPIYASCGGTVAKAGWGSGYGYVVYIDHEDGKQTRYGHCSKVLVSVGSKVKQGDKIALSGNTGITTGPHLHFEILVNGKQVNPFDYVSK